MTFYLEESFLKLEIENAVEYKQYMVEEIKTICVLRKDKEDGTHTWKIIHKAKHKMMGVA